MTPVRVDVSLPAMRYEVAVAPTLLHAREVLLAACTGPRCVVVTNPVVAPLHLPALLRALEGREARVIEVPDGEGAKSLLQWSVLVDKLISAGVDRRTPVLALGGGVTGDLAGFAAASTLRGLPFVQVPTTLLAMVDSSVGGKVGVNTAAGKNLVGAFHPPRAVVAALDTLATLPDEEVRSGLGEVLKHAILMGAPAMDLLREAAPALRARDADAMAQVVTQSVQCKAAIVAEDPLEQGRRAVLNAGHTVGHALETALGHGALRHGEAVAMGLVAEARWAESTGRAAAGWSACIRDLATCLGLRTSPPSVSAAAMRAALSVDKKRERGMIRVACPCAPGIVEIHATDVDSLLLHCISESS